MNIFNKPKTDLTRPAAFVEPNTSNNLRRRFMRPKKRTIIVLVVIAAIVVILALTDALIPDPPDETSTSVAQSVRIIPPSDRSTSITFDGVVSPEFNQLVQVSFDVGGPVASIQVRPGDRVKRGATLATLDDTSLKDAIRAAQLQLDTVEAKILEKLSPPAVRPSEIEAAKKKVDAAQASVAALKGGESAGKIRAGRARINEMNNQWKAALSRKQETCGSGPSSGCDAAHLDAGAAFEKVQAAEAEAAQYASSLPKERAKAIADLMTAEDDLVRLTQPPPVSDAQKQMWDIERKQATEALIRTQREFSKAVLFAPCDCIIQEVTIGTGMRVVANGAPAFKLIDPQSLVFRSSNLSERDLGRVKAGDVVTVSLKAFEKPLQGRVYAVLPESANPQPNGATFTIVIRFQPMPINLWSGLTGQAKIIVPSSAAR